MSDRIASNEYQELDERLREVEKSTVSIASSILNVNQNVSELKKMFQDFMRDSHKLTEIGVKINSLDRVENRVDDLDKRFNLLNSTFISIQTEHTTCQFSKNRSEDYLREINNKISKIETETTTVQNEIKNAKDGRNNIKDVFKQWGIQLGWLIILALLYTIFTSGNSFIAEKTKPEIMNQTKTMKVIEGE